MGSIFPISRTVRLPWGYTCYQQQDLTCLVDVTYVVVYVFEIAVGQYELAVVL